MKLLGIIFFNIILGAGFILLNQLVGNCFLKNFLDNQILPIGSTILGFNLAGIIFLIGHITEIESKTNADFSASKRELKHNIYFLGLVFVAILLLLFVNPTPTQYKYVDFGFNALIMTLFFMQFYAVYEILNAVFHLKTTKKS